MGNVRALFDNEDWTVTSDGMEHKSTGYLIDRAQVGCRRADGFWAWPLHMLEKSWVVPETFAEAFSAAARCFDLRAGDDLTQTFKEGGLVEAASGWRRQTGEIVLHPALSPPDAVQVEGGEGRVPLLQRRGSELPRRRGRSAANGSTLHERNGTGS